MREGLPVNPTSGLELPAAHGRRERIVPPDTAAKLLDALPAEDRALWATALYAGLRLGELRALRWDAVDLAGGLIEVRESWDPKEGPIAPKSAAGRRKVPIAAALRDILLDHRLRTERASGLMFSRDGSRPFSPGAVVKRADRAWHSQGLDPIRLHEARHTFASFMIAAGVNAKALSSYIGHGSIAITFDRCGHLMRVTRPRPRTSSTPTSLAPIRARDWPSSGPRRRPKSGGQTTLTGSLSGAR